MTERKQISRGWIVALALAACGPSDHIADELAALDEAGIKPAAFVQADASTLKAKACQQGTVDQLPAMLCEYENADQANAAEAELEGWIGAAMTGVVLERDQYRLAIADHAQLDPNGKRLADIARAFRRQPAPATASATP